jgi:hypothetical protein
LIADVSPTAELKEPLRVMLNVGIIELDHHLSIEIALVPRNPGQDKRWLLRSAHNQR